MYLSFHESDYNEQCVICRVLSLMIRATRETNRVECCTEEHSMNTFQAKDPGYQERVRESFSRQRVMSELGATLTRVRPGSVEITLPYKIQLTQQHGFIHAGIVATILDTACGYAAFSLMPLDASVLSVEFKINLLAPAIGEALVATGEVIRPGRTITVCKGSVLAARSDGDELVATMQATIMAIFDRPQIVG